MKTAHLCPRAPYFAHVFLLGRNEMQPLARAQTSVLKRPSSRLLVEKDMPISEQYSLDSIYLSDRAILHSHMFPRSNTHPCLVENPLFLDAELE